MVGAVHKCVLPGSLWTRNRKTDGIGINVSFNNAIAVIAINRIEARNTSNVEGAHGIADAVAEIELRSDIKVGILTGKGGTFCAGMDLKAFLTGEVMRFPETEFADLTGVKLNKPFIAAVERYALACGFKLTLVSNVIVVAQTAKFGLPEVKRGLVANARRAAAFLPARNMCR